MLPDGERSVCDYLEGQGIVGMPQFGSEPKFERELFRTGLKFGPRFGWMVEPDHKSGSTFGQKENVRTWFEPNFSWIFTVIRIFLLFFVILGRIFWFVCQEMYN